MANKTAVKTQTSEKAKAKAALEASPTPVLDKYDENRNGFLQRSQPRSNNYPRLTQKGLFQSDPFNSAIELTTRTAGFDTLFHTLLQGVVEDPDYAFQKDSRVYERMRRDPQIFYCLDIRKAATKGLPWLIKPPRGFENDPEAIDAAATCERRMRKIPKFTTLLDNILDALLPGLSVNELVWEVNDQGEYIVKEHYPVNKDRVKFDAKGNLRLLKPSSPTIGAPVPNYKFIAHAFGMADGSWHRPERAGYIYFGRGLADTPLYHYFYFKVSGLKYFLQALEKYGNPAKILYTGPQNAALATKLQSIMMALRNDSVAVIPGNRTEIGVETYKPPNGAAMFKIFLEYIDRLITRVILGQELMTEQTGNQGSRALGQVHKSVFGWLVEADKNAIAATLTDTLLKYDAILNLSKLPEEKYPIFSFPSAALEDAAQFLATVRTASQMGIQISKSQVLEATGLKEPENDEDILDMSMGQEYEEEPQPGQERLEGQGNQQQPQPQQ